jgi:predicted secreted protein
MQISNIGRRHHGSYRTKDPTQKIKWDDKRIHFRKSLDWYRWCPVESYQILGILTSALLMFVLLAGCSQRGAIVVTEQDSGNTIELRSGDILELVLDSNPTTGFTWEIEPIDTGVLLQIGEPEFKPDTELLGSGGKFTCRFEAASSGQTLLRLVYGRPFEQGLPQARTFQANIVVR